MAKFHKDFVMHSRDTGPLLNLGPFGPTLFLAKGFVTENSYSCMVETDGQRQTTICDKRLAKCRYELSMDVGCCRR